jgi:valyl-tRNA synthetase
LDCEGDFATFLLENSDAIKRLAGAGQITIGAGCDRPPKSAAHVLSACKVYVPLAAHIDVEAELAKQTKKLGELEGRIKGITSKLSNEGFVAKAPPEVVQQQRELQADLGRQIEAIHAILADLKG